MNKLARRGVCGLLGLATMVAVIGEAQAAPVCYALPFSNPNLADGWGSTAGGRTNPHRGVDFPQAGGTPIPAIADGTVALLTFSSCLGNVLVLAHDDGMFSGYSHMQVKSPLTVGTRVTKGQTIGKVGTTGTCTTGNHLHLSIGPSVNSYGSGTTVDPYKYIQDHKTCSCRRTAGDFTFSCDGPVTGERCVNVNEPDDTHPWADNFVCTKGDHGLAWSATGPIAGKRCTNIVEPTGADGPKWADNFLCVDPNDTVQLSWTYDGATDGKTCVAWNEPADPDTWTDNHLCIAANKQFTGGIFTFSSAGALEGQTCVSVAEPEDEASWSDNFLCTTKDIGVKWSSAGSIAGLRCTKVDEASEHVAAAWADNHVCVPDDSPYELAWSSAGPIAGKTCVPWHEAADLEGSWGDNFLCYTVNGVADGAPGGSAGGASGGNVSDAGVPSSEDTDDAAGGCSTAGAGTAASSSVLALGVGVLVALGLRRRRQSVTAARSISG